MCHYVRVTGLFHACFCMMALLMSATKRKKMRMEGEIHGGCRIDTTLRMKCERSLEWTWSERRGQEKCCSWGGRVKIKKESFIKLRLNICIGNKGHKRCLGWGSTVVCPYFIGAYCSSRWQTSRNCHSYFSNNKTLLNKNYWKSCGFR